MDPRLGPADGAPRVLLDACVLYPDLLRRILLDAAARGLFAPIWSERILEEWARAAARTGSDAGPAIARLRADWPGATAAADPATEARLTLPDPADAHVLAAAIAGRAKIVVTRNLRDFPSRTLGLHGLRPAHPDAFLLDLWRDAPAAMAAVATGATDAARQAGSSDKARALLKRAGLPRLARALDRAGGAGGIAAPPGTS